jgi:hypothetical protein
MCGPSGSGKSTYAQRFESEGMVRLSFDVEMWRRGISTVPLPQDVRDEIEAGLRARLLELVAEGTDVVLDFSFWSRRMRTEELAAQYFDHFGPPTPDEGPADRHSLASSRRSLLDAAATHWADSAPDAFAWRSIVAGEYPSASAMMAAGASLVSSCSVPSLAARVLTSRLRRRSLRLTAWMCWPGE